VLRLTRPQRQASQTLRQSAAGPRSTLMCCRLVVQHVAQLISSLRLVLHVQKTTMKSATFVDVFHSLSYDLSATSRSKQVGFGLKLFSTCFYPEGPQRKDGLLLLRL